MVRLVASARRVLVLFMCGALFGSTLAWIPAVPAGAQAEDPAPEQLTLGGTVRDFSSSHPDFEGRIGTDRGIVATQLGEDGKPVYARETGGTATTSGKANFDQWYRDVPGTNITIPLDLTLTKVQESPLLYRFADSSFFPIDGQGFGNQGRSHN